MRSEKHLGSRHGLRSLSAQALCSGQENGRRPYRRGAIWLPINFLALRALKHYADGVPDTSLEAENRDNATVIYAQLRGNVLAAVLGEWKRTRSVWEHYDDKTGRGMRSNPFTGWTSLILNIMAEKYALAK